MGEEEWYRGNIDLYVFVSLSYKETEAFFCYLNSLIFVIFKGV